MYTWLTSGYKKSRRVAHSCRNKTKRGGFCYTYFTWNEPICQYFEIGLLRYFWDYYIECELKKD